MRPVVHTLNFGRVPFRTAWEWQGELRRRKLLPDTDPMHDHRDVCLMLEHPPIYTLGRGADDKHVRFDSSVTGEDLIRIDRGGEVTHHCPGQLVIYPILDLRRYKQDLHWYLHTLEDIVISTLTRLGVEGATTIPGLTGVWVGNSKVAAIGVSARQWITVHGVAINVTNTLDGFSKIVPCGIEEKDKHVGRIVDFVKDTTVLDTRSAFIQSFQDGFGTTCQAVSGAKSPLL